MTTTTTRNCVSRVETDRHTTDGGGADPTAPVDLRILFRDHNVEAGLVAAHLGAADIVNLAMCSRVIALAVPRCMLRAAELGLLPRSLVYNTQECVDGVPFTWPLPGRLPLRRGAPASPFASWTEAFAADDLASLSENPISRFVRWTAAIKRSSKISDIGVVFCIERVSAVDHQWTSKGDPNWWLNEPEHVRDAEREERVDEAIVCIRTNARAHAQRLVAAARMRSSQAVDVAVLRADTAQLIHEAAFNTRFKRELRHHTELYDKVALSCSVGPALKWDRDSEPCRRFFDDTVTRTVSVVVNRRPPPGACGHGPRTVDAALALVERWCPQVAFTGQCRALSTAAEISPRGPEHDVGDEWTITEPGRGTRTVLRNALRTHLRARFAEYAPYLCRSLTRLCAAAAIVARACRIGDRDVVDAAAAQFCGDMEPHVLSATLREALSVDALAARAFGDRIGPDAIGEADAALAVATNANVCVWLLVRSLEAVAAMVETCPDPSRDQCRLADGLLGVAETVAARIVWAPRRPPDGRAFADGRIRMGDGARAHLWTSSAADVRKRQRRANVSLMRALFVPGVDVDAWAHVIARLQTHQSRRLSVIGECISQTAQPSHMASVIHSVVRAVCGDAARSHDEIRRDADRARRVLVAFGRVIDAPTEAAAACAALAALYDLPAADAD
ncbi:hypothetical protein [Pandoravirus japonicus]|uniref:Uncharacterized protein n=1 Tax=Pandoravirus japonicus TaxID=2823154 RepID=A0A811BNX3_9VIRU|nr:hypothetical protein [Pandoravirus japonicus]